MTTRHPICILLAVALAIPLTAACGTGEGHLTTVKIAMPAASPTPGGAMYYASLPSTTGYAEDEGLDWKSINLAGSAPAMQALQSGSVDAAIAGTDTIAAALAGGKFHAKAVYMVINGNIQIPYVPVDSEIQDAKDFEGKTVGVLNLGSANQTALKASVEAAGGDPAKVTFVAVGPGAPTAVALRRGQVDAISVADNYAAQVAALGIDLRPIEDDSTKAAGATMALAVRDDLVATDPELVERIARTIARSTVFARSNPEAAIKEHWAEYPESKANVDETAEMALQLKITQARLAAMAPVDGLWGGTGDSQVAERIRLAAIGGADTSGMTPSDVWDGSLLEAINNFDTAAVESDARNGR